MLKSARAGIAIAFLFASLASAGSLILNPRFVDNFAMGVVLWWIAPVLGGLALALFVGPALRRLAEIGTNEDPIRATELLWATFTGFSVFIASLALLPPFLGIFSDSETVRYGGGLVLSIGLTALGVVTIRYVANRFRLWIWPLLLALPVACVLLGATESGRGRGSGSRVLIVAVPGLSWNVAEDLVERGDMPNLAELRKSGAWGELHSLSQPMTSAVWTTIATGKNPETHGVVGFQATADQVQTQRIWNIFEQRGWSVGLFGWPVTWPPPAVDGFVVPAVSDIGTETSPRELNFIRELAMSEKTRRARTWGRYCRYAFLGIRYGARLSTLVQVSETVSSDAIRGRSLDSAQLFTKRKLRAKLNSDYFIELRRQHPVDFAAFYTNIVHVAQSYFWKYHEPDAYEGISPEDIGRYGDSVFDSYRIVDGFLGKILADTGPNDLVVVLSDHGAEAQVESRPDQLTLRVEPILREMRLQAAIEATNLGARTYLRMKPGHESSRERVQRLFETARLGERDIRAFDSRLDEWGNVVVTVNPEVTNTVSDILLFQGGRCPISEVVRLVDLQESAQMKETGALVLAGQGVEPNTRVGTAELVDIVPTLLMLTGLDLATDLPGDVVYEALEESHRNRFPGVVATYEPMDGPAAN